MMMMIIIIEEFERGRGKKVGRDKEYLEIAESYASFPSLDPPGFMKEGSPIIAAVLVELSVLPYTTGDLVLVIGSATSTTTESTDELSTPAAASSADELPDCLDL